MSKITLMTYPDSLGGNLKNLKIVLDKYFNDFDGLHILPPYLSTADRGFCPVTHLEIDPKLGSFEDISEISKDYYLEMDLIAGHISDKSPEFLDYLKRGDSSEHKDLFLTFDDVFGNRCITGNDITNFTRLTSIPPFFVHKLEDGTKILHFKTFTSSQVDLNINSENT